MSEYAVTDPATAEVVATYPTSTDAEIQAAIDAAAKTGRTWARTTTVAERAALIGKVAALHEQRREQLADVIVREMGKPRDQALGEVDFSAAIYQYYADNAEKFLADEEIALLDARAPQWSSAARSACCWASCRGTIPTIRSRGSPAQT